MNGIDAAGGIQSLYQINGSGGAGRAFGASGPSESMRARASSITNDQGQSLIDIKDDLQAAVAGALQNADGGDPRAAVQDALRTTLEDNGFDVDQVRSAMQPEGGRAGGFGGIGGFGGGGFGGGGFDAASALGGGGSDEDLVQQFLSQLRAGTNLDLEI